MRHYKRKVPWTSTPQVVVSGQSIVVTGRGYIGSTTFEIRGTLDTHCAKRLILELRQALRAVRNEQVKYFNDQVSEAEKILP